MTYRTAEIQTLIANIDRLLAHSSKRLSTIISNGAQEERHFLERVRDFLVRLEVTQAEVDDAEHQSFKQGQSSPLSAQFVNQSNHPSAPQHHQVNQKQSTVTIPPQLKSEFSTLIKPLQVELDTLLQHRETLAQEIRQLEQRRRQNYSLAQQLGNQEQIIAEFLEMLMSRWQSNHTPQRPANVSDSPPRQFLNTNAPGSSSSSTQPFLESLEQVEHLTRLTQELEQRLLALDGTVNTVFERLQCNIDTYEESFSEALARMHDKGVQAEQLLTDLINNLMQQLQQPLPIESLPVGKYSQHDFSKLECKNQPSALDTQLVPSQNKIINPQETDFETAKDTATKPDWDAVFSHLDVDTQNELVSTESIPTERQQDGSESVADEVEQLYASFLGTEDLTAQSLELSVDEPTDKLSVSPTNNSSATSAVSPASTTNHLQAEDSLDASLNKQNTSEASVKATEPLSELVNTRLGAENTDEFLPAEVIISSPFEYPAIADTVTALTDLLVDVNSGEQLPEVTSFVHGRANASALLNPVINQPQVSQVKIHNQELDWSLDNYIPASPQEHLFTQKEPQAVVVPDISLDKELLQQLDLDLANFEELLNSQLPSVTSLETPTTTENTLPTDVSRPDVQQEVTNSTASFLEHEVSTTEVFGQKQADTDLDSSAKEILVVSPIEHEKKEVKTDSQESFLLSNSNSKNDPEVVPGSSDSLWYLGIDLGTTGISAVLLNRSTTEVYPIYWSAEKESKANAVERSFRLPAEIYLPSTSVPNGEAGKADVRMENVFSAQLKPYLQLAIPYKNERQKWQPSLLLNEFSPVPLIWIVRSLSKLLLTLKSDRTSTTQGLTAAALGLDQKTFLSIINNIAGIICTCPSNCSEQYRFNVREALLTSKLVQHPQQVFFVEEAIASLLSVLDGANGEKVKFPQHPGYVAGLSNDHRFLGSTLIINIGATTTQMALVDLPENLQELTHSDFLLHSFAYGSKGIEQDIICQLLFPTKWRQSRTDNQSDCKTTTSNPWHWQPATPDLHQICLSSLGLAELNLPRPGEPDISDRIRLQQRLESSPLGQALQDAAIALKLILQHQDSFTLELADQQWVLQQPDLENLVFVPFVQHLNRELNKLLVNRGISIEAINQAILTGGVASLSVIRSWLRQKLPNAKIIQDSYLGENGAPSCSRVAYGLAMLPLHPQVLEVPSQQYTDYFLFTELLRLVPDKPLSFDEVIQLFESRGINTRACQQRLLAFLEGELPTGLIPNSADSTWLTQTSKKNSDYNAIAAAPLFEKQGSLTYCPNSQQLRSVRRYLDAIKASTLQSLEEPYTVNFTESVHLSRNTGNRELLTGNKV